MKLSSVNDSDLLIILNKIRGKLDPESSKEFILACLYFNKYLNEDLCNEIIESSKKRMLIEKKIISINSNRNIFPVPDIVYKIKLSETLYNETISLIFKMTKSLAPEEDMLGRVYEYFLSFLENIDGGQHFTPRDLVELLARSLDIQKGKIYDPCCGSGGMFTQSHNLHLNKKIKFYGQELSTKSRELALMNAEINDINLNLGNEASDTLQNDEHIGSKFDFILTNPPFNQKEWGLNDLLNDKRWIYGIPPTNNANMAWVQHVLSKLKQKGRAGIFLANGSLTSGGDELAIKKKIFNEGLVECMISIPGKMFSNTPIPVTIWLFNLNPSSRNKKNKEVLMIDLEGSETRSSKRKNFLNSETINMISAKIIDFRNENLKKESQTDLYRIVGVQDIADRNFKVNPSRYLKRKKIKKLNLDLKNFGNLLHKRENEINRFI